MLETLENRIGNSSMDSLSMNNFNTTLNEYKMRLEAVGIRDSSTEIKTIIERIVGLNLETVIQCPQKVIDKEAQEKIEKAIQCRENRLPIERIFGTATFCGLKLQVANNVFKPYPETEDLVEHALNMVKDKNAALRILDLGAGTGCILLALLCVLPHATGLGIDIDDHAINIARINAQTNNLCNRAEFRIGNWADGITEKFDIIISNPPRVASADIPYLLPEIRDYDPHIALDGGIDGLFFLKMLTKDFPRLAKPEALGLFQLGPKYADHVSKLLRATGLQRIEIKYNYLRLPSAIAVINQTQERPFDIWGWLRHRFLKQRG